MSKTLHSLCLGLLLLAGSVAPATAEEPILSLETAGHQSLIWEVLFTPDGRYLLSAGADKMVRVWDVATGETVRVLRGQIGPGDAGKIFAAALSPDGSLLALGGYLGPYTGTGPSEEEEAHKIRLVDFKTGEVVRLLKGHTNVINGLAFSPDGRRLVSGSFDTTARIWDVASGKTLQVLKGHSQVIYAVAFSPDGRRLATGSDDNTLRLWEADGGRQLAEMVGHTAAVRCVSFLPDGGMVSGAKDKSVRLWDRNGRAIKVLAEQNRTVDSLAVTPDGTRLLTGTGTGSGSFINSVFAVPSGKSLLTFSQSTNVVLATAISPDGRLAATGGGNNNEIHIWELATGKVRKTLAGAGKKAWTVGFSGDGRSVAWGSTWKTEDLFGYGPLEQSFRLQNETGYGYEPAMGHELSEAEAGSYVQGRAAVGNLSVRTPNGLVNKTMEILRDNRVVHSITRGSTNGYDHRSLTVSPDGQVVVSGGSNGNLASYDPDTGKELHDFVGHTGDVWGVAVSPDSRLLVSGSGDQTVRVWELASGRPLLTIFCGTDREWVAWTPDGYYTSSLAGDRYVGWHINQGPAAKALYYPASRFAGSLRRPEIVSAYLSTGGDLERSLHMARQESPRRQTEERVAVAQMLPPAVFFKLPVERDVTVTEPRILVRAAAKSVNSEPVTDIWLTVNGRRLGQGGRGINLVGRGEDASPGLGGELEYTVDLTEKENRIAVFAANRQAQSEPEIINVRWQPSTKRQEQGRQGDIFRPNLYLLAIGVSDYANPDFSLDVAHKDAEALAQTLAAQEGKLYSQVKTRLLTNQKATKDNVLDGLDWLLAEATQKDVAVIFVAGHGIKDTGGNYYFLPHDADEKRLRRTGVKWFDFQDTLTRLPSKVILMADTCHSGSITGKRRGVSDMTDALRELVTSESGVVVMTAATGREVSQERPDWGHGAFTKAVIEALSGKANYNNDSTVDIKELDLYVTTRVKELTNGAQHPTTEIPRTMPNFPVAFY